MRNELVFDREAVKKSLRDSMLSHTVKVFSGPEGDAELPDEGLPDEIEEEEPEGKDEGY